MRVQVGRQRKEILQLQRAGILAASTETFPRKDAEQNRQPLRPTATSSAAKPDEKKSFGKPAGNG